MNALANKPTNQDRREGCAGQPVQIMMKFKEYDAGRSTSFRPKQGRDCVVRVYAIMMDIPYDSAYETFAGLGRKSGCSTPKRMWQNLLCDHAVVELRFPAVSGQKRMNLISFCNEYRLGTFLVQMAGHVTAVIDGVVHDVFEPRHNGCVYAAWRKE